MSSLNDRTFETIVLAIRIRQWNVIIGNFQKIPLDQFPSILKVNKTPMCIGSIA